MKIAIGKAAKTMALGLAEALGDKLVAGVISAPELLNTQPWESFVGGHPLPNEASLEAARATFQLLERANSEQALAIFLISGGGSAIAELFKEGVGIALREKVTGIASAGPAGLDQKQRSLHRILLSSDQPSRP